MASEPTVPEDEELNMDELDDDMGEDVLVNLLTTEDGETITSVLANISTQTEAIAKHLEKQNVILVKLLSALSAKPATQ
jgi:hypothetical protein